MASTPRLLEQDLAKTVGERYRQWPETEWEHPALSATGPVLCSFAHWLATQRCPSLPLFCILREGQLLRRLVQALGIPDVREIDLNRRLCLKAAILSAEDQDGLLNVLVRARRRPMTAAEAVTELELPPPPLPDDSLLAIGSPELASFLSWLRTPVPATALTATTTGLRTRLLTYLERIGALTSERLVLADLGYATNIQNALEKILRHERKGGNTLGLYLVTTPGATWTLRRGGEIRSFLAHLGEPGWFTRLFARAPEPLEALCTSSDGPLVDYTTDGLPIRIPSLLPMEQMQTVKDVQDILQIQAKTFSDTDTAAARLRLARFLALPTAEEANTMASWVYEETLDATTRPLSPACSGDPWRLDRAAMPWPAGAARQAGWKDKQLLHAAKTLAILDIGPKSACCP